MTKSVRPVRVARRYEIRGAGGGVDSINRWRRRCCQIILARRECLEKPDLGRRTTNKESSSNISTASSGYQGRLAQNTDGYGTNPRRRNFLDTS